MMWAIPISDLALVGRGPRDSLAFVDTILVCSHQALDELARRCTNAAESIRKSGFPETLKETVKQLEFEFIAGRDSIGTPEREPVA